jgi:hypothetical protein
MKQQPMEEKQMATKTVTKTVWRVYVDYGSGYGWVPVNWAPTFKTETEAHDWINGDHDWESPVRAMEDTVEVDEVTITITSAEAEVLAGLLAQKIDEDDYFQLWLEDVYTQLIEEDN